MKAKNKSPYSPESAEKIRQAEEIYQAAKDRFEEAKINEGKAALAVSEAHHALTEARKQADEELPKCKVVLNGRFKDTEYIDYVIIKRTDKSIKARRLGSPNESHEEFRRNKYTGKWAGYPEPKYYASYWKTLLLPEDGESSP